MNEKERARQREYNKNHKENHPDYANEWVKKKYREDEEYRERTKWLQKKNYYKRLGYNYEQYDITSDWANAEVIEHIKDYIWEAEEIKLIRTKKGWSLEIKTKIKE